MPHPICSQERLAVKSHFDPCTCMLSLIILLHIEAVLDRLFIVYICETVFISDCLFQATKLKAFYDQERKTEERTPLILTTTRRPLYLQQRERWFYMISERERPYSTNLLLGTASLR